MMALKSFNRAQEADRKDMPDSDRIQSIRPLASKSMQETPRLDQKHIDVEKATEAIVKTWTLANKYDIDFESAMVIVVGQQSAGKTSFVERYLGYAFSVVRKGIATKRPSVLTILPPEPEDGDDLVVKVVEEVPGGGRSAELQFRGTEALNQLHEWVEVRNQTVAKERLFITIVTRQCKTPRRITDLPGVRASDEEGSNGINMLIIDMVTEAMLKPNSIVVCLAEATSEPVSWALY